MKRRKERTRRALLLAALLFTPGLAVHAQGNVGGAGAPLPAAELKKKVETFVRNLYALGPSYRVTVGEPKDADLPGFSEVTIEVAFQDSSDQAVMYASKDGRNIIRGELFRTDVDPFAGIRSQIKLEGHPFRGSANATVVVVEYADFQCPSCKQLYDTLKQVVPLYPQVKFVFKDFPLEQIHPWARNAAHAGRCAYQQSPAAFWKLHDLLFENQANITPADHWDKLQQYATQIGLDANAFRMCLTAPETKAAVDASIEEGLRLRIANTPTAFINGRRMVGGSREQLEQILQFELQAAKPTAPVRPVRP